MSLIGFIKGLSRSTKLAFAIGLILFAVIWFATPYYLRDYLNKIGEGLPDYHLHIDWVQINPLPCSIDVEGVSLAKRSDEIPVPFFTCPRVYVAMQWATLLHGNLRSSISLIKPVVNFVQGPTPETSQLILEPAWVEAVKKLVPLRINKFTVSEGVVHFRDFHTNPQIDLIMDRVELALENLTNSNGSPDAMPSTAILTGRPMKVGKLEVRLALNVDLTQPTFAEKVKLEKVPMPTLNPFLAKYGSVYAKSGQCAFYSEMVSEQGKYNGYLKPFLKDLSFEPVPKDRDGFSAIWASLVNGAKDLLENRNGNVATQVNVSGHYQDPHIDFWSAAFELIRNAYLQALAEGFDRPEIAPAPEKEVVSKQAVIQAKDQK